MRVWDVNPGYLNRQSLLGEHREIHAILSIVTHGKKGYAHHPETLRWKENLEALRYRHELVASEMRLRGYQHHGPVTVQGTLTWPNEFVDSPVGQFGILQNKYLDREPGRISLPGTTQGLWAQHKYSVLARDPGWVRQIGRTLARTQNDITFEQLALELTEILRVHPSEGRLMNALQHMWGYVSKAGEATRPNALDDPNTLISAIRELALKHQVIYLIESTALSDLHMWISVSH